MSELCTVVIVENREQNPNLLRCLHRHSHLRRRRRCHCHCHRHRRARLHHHALSRNLCLCQYLTAGHVQHIEVLVIAVEVIKKKYMQTLHTKCPSVHS